MTLLPSFLASIGFIPLPLAQFAPQGLGPLLIPLAGMGLGLAGIIFGSLEKFQKRRLRHELMRVALEKGQPLPPELLDEPRVNPSRDDRRSGLIAIAFGIALTIALYALSDHIGRLYLFGLIPLLVGVALLVNWWLERRGGADQSRR